MWHRATQAVLVGSLLVIPLLAGETQEIPIGLGGFGEPSIASSEQWCAIGRENGVNLYERHDGTWSFKQHLDNPEGGDSQFGFGYAVAMDEEWLAVGAAALEVAGLPGSGGVFAYRREGRMWVRTHKVVTPVPHVAELFGSSVTLADGYLFIRNSPLLATTRSALWVYRLTGSEWKFVQEIAVERGATERAVDFALPWLLVGESYDSPERYSWSGRARFFELTSNGFEYRQEEHGATKSFFGASVALDGNLALIGAPGFRVHAPGHNRAHVMRLDESGTWVVEQTLAPDVLGEDLLSDQFGYRVDLQGNRAVVGAPWLDFDGDKGGAIFTYERSGDVWALTEHLRPSDQAAGDEFGDSVLFAADSILASAPWHLHDGLVGAVYSFEF